MKSVSVDSSTVTVLGNIRACRGLMHVYQIILRAIQNTGRACWFRTAVILLSKRTCIQQAFLVEIAHQRCKRRP